VTTATRWEGLPCQLWATSCRVYEASNFRGIGAPVGIVEKLKEINSILADPNVKARIADIGGTVLPGSPADFGKLIGDETEKWAKVIKFSGARAD
jgi:hypothetical protein